jgi:hypothetical protein
MRPAKRPASAGIPFRSRPGRSGWWRGCEGDANWWRRGWFILTLFEVTMSRKSSVTHFASLVSEVLTVDTLPHPNSGCPCF